MSLLSDFIQCKHKFLAENWFARRPGDSWRCININRVIQRESEISPDLMFMHTFLSYLSGTTSLLKYYYKVISRKGRGRVYIYLNTDLLSARKHVIKLRNGIYIYHRLYVPKHLLSRTYLVWQFTRQFRSRVCRLRSNFFFKRTRYSLPPTSLPSPFLFSLLRLHLAASELLKVHSGIPESGPRSARKEDDCNHVGS